MTFRFLKKVVIWLVYASVVAAPLFYFKKGVYPYVLGKTLVFQAIVELAFAGWVVLAWNDSRYRLRRWSPIAIGSAVFFGALLLTAFTGQDISRSIWSSQERAGGVILFAHLAMLAVVVAGMITEVQWKKLLATCFGVATFVSFLAILQLYIPNLLLVENVGNRPGATFGNPTFLAGYLLFNLWIGLFFLLEALQRREASQKSNATIRLAVISGALLLNLIALFNTQTRGDLLGFGVSLFAFLVFLIARPLSFGPRILQTRKFYAVLVSALVLCGGVFWFTRTNAIWKPIPGLNRFSELSFDSKSLEQPRFFAYQAAWKGFLEKPIVGFGYENFNIAYNKYYNPRTLEWNYQETRFDKPHNLYLEYLVSGGIILFAAFLFLVGTYAWSAWRSQHGYLGPMLLSALIAYLIRSIFVFDTLGPLLMLYVILGVMYGLESQSHQSESSNGQRKQQAIGESASIGGGWLVLAGAVLVAYSLNYLSLTATYYQYYGYKYFQSNKPEKALASFRQAINTFTPYQWNLKRDFATTVAEAYFYNPDRVSADAAKSAVAAMQDVVRAHPRDAFNHYAFIDIYNQVSDVNPTEYLAAAEREAAIALELSPNRQEVYFSLAKTKSLQNNDYAAGIELIKKAIALDPKVPDGHFYYGILAYAAGDTATGYRELKTAIDMGRPWKNYYEPRTVANFFADSEHYDEAIALYQKTLTFTEDAEARLKLGILYYIQGDRAGAIRELTKGLSETDITKSPYYSQYYPVLLDLGLVRG